MKIVLKAIINPFREKNNIIWFSHQLVQLQRWWMIEASITKLVLGIAVTEVQNGGSGGGKVYSYNYK